MRILSLGDRALTVEFASGFDANARRAVILYDRAIMQARNAGVLPGIVDVAPTFRSLTVHYDPFQTTRVDLEQSIRALAIDRTSETETDQTVWRLPVCYGGQFGPDLSDLALDAGMSQSALVDLHAGTAVSVHMLGFLPGFAFMAKASPARAPPTCSSGQCRRSRPSHCYLSVGKPRWLAPDRRLSGTAF